MVELKYIAIGVFCFILLLLLGRKQSIKQNTEFSKLLMEDLNDNLLVFSSFLDEFNEKYSCSKEYMVTKSFNLNVLYENYCKHCKNNTTCYEDKKHLAYKFLSNALDKGNELNFKNQDSEVIALIKNCPYTNEIINTSTMIKNRSTVSKGDYLLGSQLESLSTIVKNYVMDKNREFSIDSYNILSILRRIKQDTKLLHFNIYDSSYEDLNVVLYYKKITSSSIRTIRRLFKSKYRQIEVVKEVIDSYIKVSITKKFRYKFQYSSSSFAKGGQLISGDNYLVKNSATSSKLIATLCDGMGKGYEAYNESKNVLELVNSLSSTNIKTESFFNIMNTFYRLKEYNDIYSTLDYVELSRSTGKLKIYKMGSATSYLFKGNGDIISITNRNLPLGIDLLVYSNEYTVDDGDILFILSDGVTDMIPEEELKKQILTVSNQDVDTIVNSFINKYTVDDDNEDDLSIICIKINRVA